MKTFSKAEILKNVGSSWFALGINVLVGIFISPYILHRLGDDAFGLWVLIFSVTGYYGLFDLGIRSSIVRYVAKYSAVDDHEQLNRLISTSLASYTAVCLVCLLLTGVGAFFVSFLFRVSPDFLITARWLFLMVGTAVALGFPLGVFGGVLEGLQRFYLLNLTSVTSILLRALLIVIVLKHGGGLLSVALITMGLPLITAGINAVFVFHLLPLELSRRLIDRTTLKKIANYGGTTFIIIVAGRLRFKTDALVIGTFLSSAAITYFAIGSRLVDYASEVVSSLAQVFVPMSSQSDATGDLARLRKIFVAGNRVCAMVIFPITAMLIILGKSVIEAWVGKRYVATSYPVLLVLLIPSTLMLAQAASGRILFGMGRHRTWAWVVLAEGVANLILSIVLVRRFGILGRRRHCHSARLQHAVLPAPSSLPPVADSAGQVPAGSLRVAAGTLRSARGHASVDASLVRGAQLCAAGHAACRRFGGVWHRSLVGSVDSSGISGERFFAGQASPGALAGLG